MALNMLQLEEKFGKIFSFSPLIFVRRQFQEIDIAVVLLGQKPRHVKTF